jgi:hypothetical protein
MLLSGLACVLPASAAKRYVQVSSSHQLADGANYVVGAVNANASAQANFPRFYDMNASNAVTQTVFKETTGFPSSMVFTLHQIPDLECACTDAGHNDPSHIFVMSQGELTVINNGNSATLSTTTEATYPTTAYIHFLPYSSTHFPDETLFAVMFNYNAANRTFAASRAMGTGGFNTFTSRGTVQYFDNHDSWSSVTRVYLEIDESDLLPAAKALMEGCVYEEAEKWTAHFQDRTYAEALKAALIEGAKAEVSIEAYDKTYANLESETQAYVKGVVRNKVAEVLDQWLDGRIVKLQNQGSTHYMAGHPADGINLGTCEEITAASSWGLKKKNGGWIIKNYDQHFVTGTESIGVTYDENAAVVVNIVANDDYTVSLALASDATKLLRAAGNDAIRAAEWSTTDDAYAHWKFYGINYTVQFAARQTEKERIASVIATNNLHHLYLAEEYNALIADLNVIDCTEPESNQEKVTKLEEVSAALAALDVKMWNILNGKHIAFYFNRKNAMVAVNDDLSTVYAPNGTATDKSIWQLQYAVDGKFRLYNPATERWLAYNPNIAAVATADAAELFKITAYSSTNVANNPLALEATTPTSGYKFLHKSNSDITGLIKYNNGDAGSALFICRTAEDFYDWLAPSVESRLLPEMGTTFIAELGAARNSIPTDTEVKESLLQNGAGTGYDDFIGVITTVARIETEYTTEAYPFGGAFITLTPYHETLNHIKLHHSTKTTQVSANTEMVLGLLTTDAVPDGYVDEQTEANSIWFYKNGNLVNYDDGFYAGVNKGGTTNRSFGVCNDASNNSGDAVKIVNGLNNGTSQLIVGTDCGLHIHKSGTYVVANRCTNNNRATVTGASDAPYHDMYIALVSELPVSVHSDGWGSFSSPITYSIPDAAGCTFFGAKLEDESLSLYELAAGTKLAGGTSVLFSGPAGQTVRMPLNYCEEGNAEYTGFGGTHIAAPHTESAGMKTFAKTAPAAAESGISTLSVDPSAVVSLSAVTDAKPVHSMTLTVPESDTDINSDGSAYTLRVGELTTGIRQIVVNRLDGTHTIYDLQGRRLSDPVKGSVNIIDGKKILVK